MDNSITQANQNDKQISKSIKRFFMRFHISPSLPLLQNNKIKKLLKIQLSGCIFYRCMV